MYIKIETTRLDYIRNNQTLIRAEFYERVTDSISIEETKGKNSISIAYIFRWRTPRYAPKISRLNDFSSQV